MDYLPYMWIDRGVTILYHYTNVDPAHYKLLRVQVGKGGIT